MYELELFAGAGGGILAQRLLGHVTVGAIEVIPYCRQILLNRQRDQCIPMFPVWDDVRTFREDNPECAEYITWLKSIKRDLCISGGFPCQDISSCGTGRGITGRKSGLWAEMARIIREIRPACVFAENSPLITSRGLEIVLADLAEMGYDARWCVLGAGHIGYPVKRDRFWLLGRRHTVHGQGHESGMPGGVDHQYPVWSAPELPPLQDADIDRLLADGILCRAPDGVADRVDRIESLGNGQVPDVAALAWRILSGDLAGDQADSIDQMAA